MAEPPVQHPPLPRVEQLPRRLTGPICCPHQTSLAHIPFIVFDMRNDGQCHFRFMDVQNRRLSRVVATATLRYRGKPVTPRRNPSNPPPQKEKGKVQAENKTGGVSYHIIRLKNTLQEDDLQKMVDLLIDDQSQYCLGFRRGTTDGTDEVWEAWYRVMGDFEWPSFLDAEELPIRGDHSTYVEIGGFETLNDILRGLWGYPDALHDRVTLKRAFLRAVVVFCETLRLLSVWLEVYNRILLNLDASALLDIMWKRIRNWSSACEFVLTAAGENHGIVNSVMFWERYNKILGYGSFEDIINELRLLNWQESLLDHYKGANSLWLKRKQPGTEVANPSFDPPGQME